VSIFAVGALCCGSGGTACGCGTGALGNSRAGFSGTGAGAGVGIIFGNYLAAAVRNPSAAQGQFGNLIFGFAVTEALGIFSLLIALLLLFVPL